MKWFLYNILFAAAYLALLPKYLWRMKRRGGYRAGFEQRFGFYGAQIRSRLARSRHLWIHAVSVGEVNVALGFIEELRRRRPELGVVLTVNTSTGAQVASRALPEQVTMLYVPVDFPGVVRRVVALINPVALVLTEGEYWPNLVRELGRQGRPVAVINGRLSAASAKGYQSARWFFREIFAAIDLCIVQSSVDQARLTALGVRSERMVLDGSAKYDAPPPRAEERERGRELLRKAGIPDEACVIVGGSTWPGEEAVLVAACRAARAHADGPVALVLVPRHMERGDEVARELAALQLPVVRRRAMGEAPLPHDPADELPVVLVDTTGEMRHCYAVADVVFVGKSLAPHRGGQNMIEPALFGVPVICGPHTENFPGVMADLRAAEALVEVADPAALVETIVALVGDASRRRLLGERIGETVAARSGVIARSVDRLLPLLG